MAQLKLAKAIAAGAAVKSIFCAAGLLMITPATHAGDKASPERQLVAIRIESATQILGVGGSTPLRVVGVLRGGGTRVLHPGEARLHITPARGGRILANHQLYPRMKGDLHVHATVGKITSKAIRFEAVPF